MMRFRSGPCAGVDLSASMRPYRTTRGAARIVSLNRAFFGRLRTAALAGLACGWAAPAFASSHYTVTVATPDLGAITAGSVGDTDFRIDPNSGTTTVVSGSGVRTGAGGARALVTVSCAAVQAGDCSLPVNMRVAPIGTPIGRARTVTNIQIASGTAVITSAPVTLGAAITFAIGPIGPNSQKTFWVGADLDIAGDDSGLPTGAAESDITVWAADHPTAPIASGNGGFRAEVIRGLSIGKTSDLVFGSVVKPPSGSGAVVIDPASGARTLSGGVVGIATPPPTRATFSVTGEGGQAISVTVPASFQMTGPQVITVTTTHSVTGAAVLSGVLGAQGSYAFGVGGSAPITSVTPDGSYTGAFTVTVAYN
jgi:hypothetical protein